MEIIVEIGTEEHQVIIKQELASLESAITSFTPPLEINGFIIPLDFQATINRIQGTASYRAVRGEASSSINVIAKIVPGKNGVTLVFSPEIYSERFDTMVRYFIFAHEIVHVANRRDFAPVPKEPFVKANYLGLLYQLYDEYRADATAYQAIENLFQEASDRWKDYLKAEVIGFASILSDIVYYDSIKSEITKFRRTAKLEQFLTNIQPLYDDVVISITHFFALYHYKPDLFDGIDFSSFYFVNDKTFSLMDYMKEKQRNHLTNIEDGLEVIREFMTNFGFKMEERPFGGYCQVLDI